MQRSDEQTEAIIGRLLRVGVIAAAVFVAFGGILYLFKYGRMIADYSIFRGEPSDLKSLSGILSDALALRRRGLIQLGLVLLIATPIARVVFSVFAFMRQRDLAYAMITLAVLSLLVYSLLGGQ
ncbi:MAG: DUF1634 domain-containing protein [Candidatus Omnitrophica bacterium]|nr:DUF1634 domain-containing protein [Candidatus Omnitrophota bacterium]